MVKNHFYLLFLFLFISQFSYSQEDTLFYRHSIVVNLNDLLIKRLLITFTKPIDHRSYLELSLGAKYSDQHTVESGSIFNFKDAFWYYNAGTFRAGVRRYNTKEDLYLTISSNFDYQFFNRIRFKRYVDYDGDIADKDCIISRNKTQLGGLIKGGYFERRGKHFIFESYIGIGLLFSHEEESILAAYDWTGNSLTGYPHSSSKNRFIPTFHFGLAIGFVN
jgi:hypothetical protein